MDHLQKMGFKGTILTYAKETVFDHHTNKQHGLGVATEGTEVVKECENITAWREGTLKTVDLLREGDQLAVKFVNCSIFYMAEGTNAVSDSQELDPWSTRHWQPEGYHQSR